MFELAKHKAKLLQAISDCFEPLRSDLGNVHPDMRQNPYISGALLGICRGYANAENLNDNAFNLLVDSVFEEVFRHQSLNMQSTAETWLNDEQAEFMNAYYHARENTDTELKLDWLSLYANNNYQKASTLQQPL